MKTHVMRPRAFLNLATACALLAGGPRLSAGADAPPAGAVENLISNGDFEAAKPDGTAPQDWPVPAGGAWGDEDGNRFLRLQSTEPDKMNMVYREIRLPQGVEALRLTWKQRVTGLKRGKESWFDARIMLDFMDADRGKVGPSPKAPSTSKDTGGWQERSTLFAVPANARILKFMPALFRVESGTIDFDDFLLTPVDPALLKQEAVKQAAAVRSKVKREAGQNLLANGDFESLKNGAAEHWFGKNSTNIYCMEEAENHFLRLRATNPGKLINLYRIIPLAEGDRALELSFRVRYENIAPGAQVWYDGRMIMNFVGPDKKKLSGAPTPYFRGTSKGWRSVTNRFTIPESAVSLEFMPSLFMVKTGTLDLDDFRLTVLDAAASDAMIAAKAAEQKQKDERAAILEREIAGPPITREIKVAGNKLVTSDGQEVWLQGLSCDSMQWGPGESILWSIHVALNEWNANIIRLAVNDNLWFGRPEKGSGPGGEEKYRKTVDDAIRLCAAKGAWLILDLHRFRAPTEQHRAFWLDAAARYTNNPAVLFELFNEPHDITWEVWRNGGEVTDKVKRQEGVAVENQEKLTTFQAVGMQQLVEAVRSTGARNMVLAGGLSWSYNLSGVLKGFALDDPAGNGVMYVWHNYPWKKDWQANGLDIAEKHPVILTEVGAIRDWSDFSFIGPSERFPLEGWAEDMIGCIQKYKIHWTAFSFHPKCGPMIIQDFNYTPTPYWGVFVRDALNGKPFPSDKLR